mmetsp:Transcript_58095/g.66318  ORF Transcript_58095/g.66318 Transcript_58095/m.66318 type:complete len:88 (+) Transcript_58095:30-293(+)
MGQFVCKTNDKRVVLDSFLEPSSRRDHDRPLSPLLSYDRNSFSSASGSDSDGDITVCHDNFIPIESYQETPSFSRGSSKFLKIYAAS